MSWLVRLLLSMMTHLQRNITFVCMARDGAEIPYINIYKTMFCHCKWWWLALVLHRSFAFPEKNEGCTWLNGSCSMDGLWVGAFGRLWHYLSDIWKWDWCAIHWLFEWPQLLAAIGPYSWPIFTTHVMTVLYCIYPFAKREKIWYSIECSCNQLILYLSTIF